MSAGTPVTNATIITILFTDIEGSSLLWEQDSARMRVALARHDELLRGAVQANHGTVVKMMGDGMHAAFDDPSDAVRTVLQLQQALTDPDSTAGVQLLVRCGLHAGVVERRDNDFFGNAVNRAARIMDAAHGGQVLLSQPIATLLGDRLPPLASLYDLGKVRLRNLATSEQVYQLMHPSLQPRFPALRALEETPNNLPQHNTHFIGRENDIAECLRLLDQARLLTLTGIGGAGKTRLALQLAQRLLGTYLDGVWFVDLAPVQDAQRVTPLAANVVGIREVPATPLMGTLVQHLRTQNALIILDNCEHVINSATDLTDALLKDCTHLKVLATSRESLGLASEQTFGVRSLTMPAGTDMAALHASDAVGLFMERARVADPALDLDSVNGPVIADICRRVDGIPLAIELAAARVKMLNVEEIRTRLNDRFRLLTGGSRAVPRHRTLLATIQWSYDQLTAQEQRLFRRLGVFTGGWTLAAAVAISANDADEFEVLDTLSQLMDKSLISIDRTLDGNSRYTMLETVRQYALDRLDESGEGDSIRTAHLAFFSEMAGRAAKELPGPDHETWLSRLDNEHENMLAAHRWCDRGDGEAQQGLELTASLCSYWRYRALLELGERITAEALDRETAKAPTLARSHALAANSTLKFVMGRYAESRLCDEQSLSIARAVGDKEQVVLVQSHLGMVCNAQGDFVQAREHLNSSLAVAEELGGAWLRRVRHDMAELLRMEGDADAAEPIYEQLLKWDREQGHRSGMAEDLENLAIVSVLRGAPERARTLLHDALTIADQIDNKLHALSVLDISASLATLTHEWARAARFHGAARRLMEHLHLHREPVDDAAVLPRIAEARGALGEIEFAAALSAGRSLSREQALAEVRAWLQTAENGVASGA